MQRNTHTVALRRLSSWLVFLAVTLNAALLVACLFALCITRACLSAWLCWLSALLLAWAVRHDITTVAMDQLFTALSRFLSYVCRGIIILAEQRNPIENCYREVDEEEGMESDKIIRQEWPRTLKAAKEKHAAKTIDPDDGFLRYAICPNKGCGVIYPMAKHPRSGFIIKKHVGEVDIDIDVDEEGMPICMHPKDDHERPRPCSTTRPGEGAGASFQAAMHMRSGSSRLHDHSNVHAASSYNYDQPMEQAEAEEEKKEYEMEEEKKEYEMEEEKKEYEMEAEKKEYEMKEAIEEVQEDRYRRRSKRQRAEPAPSTDAAVGVGTMSASGPKVCGFALAREGKSALSAIKASFQPVLAYLYRGVRRGLEPLLLRPGFLASCEEWRHRYDPRTGMRKNTEFMTDIWDGKRWEEHWQDKDGNPLLQKEGTLAFQLNIDWFDPFTYTKYSMGGIYLAILNLPREERYKSENMLLIGILPGPREVSRRQLQHALEPLVDELLELWRGGSLPSKQA
jgi:hypothetical protein